METLQQRLVRHEGLRLIPYRDTLGKLTIGIGRCLDTRGITEDEAMILLNNDIENVKNNIAKSCPFVLGLDQTRQDVLYEMCFQLGLNGILKFPKMLAAMRDHDYETAASEMLNSAWHAQTPARCEELAELMLNGGENGN